MALDDYQRLIDKYDEKLLEEINKKNPQSISCFF